MNLKEEQLANLNGVVQNGVFSFYRAGSDSSGLVRQLEELAKEYFNVPCAIALNSATAGLHIAQTLIGYKWQDTTFVPAVTFSATASSGIMAGRLPHIVDVEPDTNCIDFTQIKPTVDHHANIVAVHLHGHPADMDKCPSIPLIEDCAQAIGAEYKGRKVGTVGKCGVFSFNANKQIQCGEGGLFITSDEELGEKARLVANHGEVKSRILGYNYRLTEPLAAILIPQFRQLDTIIERRRELAHGLSENIKDIEGITPPIEREGCKHSYCTYAVKLAEHINRDELQAALLKEGVYFGKGGYKPLHMFPFYKGMKRYNLPHAEYQYEHVMYTNKFDEVDKIVGALKKCLKN